MSGYTKQTSGDRQLLRERIILKAQEAFRMRGIKGITMDEIASMLCISKRTLYEIFADKQELLGACILYNQERRDEYAREVVETSSNVLEVILRIYQHAIEHFHKTNRKFFDDMKRYPKACELLAERQHRDSDRAVAFFKQGVEQGVFRNDVRFEIVHVLVKGWMDMLLDTDLCKQYSFVEVFESIMFTFLRGISTEQGARELNNFIEEYRKKQQ